MLNIRLAVVNNQLEESQKAARRSECSVALLPVGNSVDHIQPRGLIR